MNSYIIMDDRVSMCINMIPYLIDNTHPNFQPVICALQQKRYQDIPGLITMEQKINKFLDIPLKNVDIKFDRATGIMTHKGKILPGNVVVRIIKMVQAGYDAQPLVKFLENLAENPSRSVVSELYQFLEYGDMPITPDGYFLAYKRVNTNYTSVHDSHTKNNIGTLVSMKRELVDSNSNNTCSSGLHFCSHEYLEHYSGDRILILKINPRDVVSIPKDYNDTKGRACQYLVISELNDVELKQIDIHKESIWDSPIVDTTESCDVSELKYDRLVYEAMGFYDSQLSETPLYVTNEMNPDYAVGVTKGNNQRGGVNNKIKFGKHTKIKDVIRGYNVGYVEGKQKISYFEQSNNSYRIGYAQGYKDGKGHTKRLFKDIG